MHSVMEKGYYYSDLVTGKLIHAINHSHEADQNVLKSVNLTEREINFLKLACTELTYKEIADQLSVSPRTVDGYRDMLFEKLDIKTRVGLAIYAIKNGIVTI